MTRALGIIAGVGVVLLFFGREATASDGLPWGVTCAKVREKVAQHGEVVALAYAERNYSARQVRAARKCLRRDDK